MVLNKVYSVQEISEIAGLPIRTIRYYIQKGLVDRPEGARKTASYTQDHLEQLMTVKRLSESGLSLAAIEKTMAGKSNKSVFSTYQQPGQVSVLSRVHICEGVELTIDSQQCGLTQTHITHIASEIAQLMTNIAKEENNDK